MDLQRIRTFLRTQAREQLKSLRESGMPDLPLRNRDQAGEWRDFGEHGESPDYRSSLPAGYLGKYAVTQGFGNRNQIERFSGGVNYGVDIGTPEGTPVSLPPGRWEVEQAFGQARGRGRIGDATNSGYGNSALVRNLDTGEKLRLSHLSEVGVRPGQRLAGGLIGRTGATGNVTGPHLDVEYMDQAGRLADVLRSKYGRYLLGGGN